MKHAFKFFALLAVAVVCAAPLGAFARPPQDRTTVDRKVQFERGRTTAVIKNTIRQGTNHHYTLRASAGQTMTVHLAAKSSGVTVYLPNEGAAIEEADGVVDWSGELPESGEYLIEVATDAKAAPYTLEVSIR